jgi:hypothetical protein
MRTGARSCELERCAEGRAFQRKAIGTWTVRLLAGTCDRGLREYGKIAGPFFVEGRRHHNDDGPPPAVSESGQHGDAESDERLSHADFIRQHDARLIAETAQNLRDRSLLPKRIGIADAIVPEIEALAEIADIDGPSHDSNSSKVVVT